MNQLDALLDLDTAAAMLGLSPHTLRSYRRSKRRLGPRFTRIGFGRVVYPLSELTAFIERQRAESFARTDIN